MFGGSRTVVVGNGVYNDVDYWCLVPSDHLGSTASKKNGKVDHQSRRYSRETVLRRNGTYSIGIQCLLHVVSHLPCGLISGSVDIHLLTVDSWSVPNTLASMVNFSTLSSNTATSPIEWQIYIILHWTWKTYSIDMCILNCQSNNTRHPTLTNILNTSCHTHGPSTKHHPAFRSPSSSSSINERPTATDDLVNTSRLNYHRRRLHGHMCSCRYICANVGKT